MTTDVVVPLYPYTVWAWWQGRASVPPIVKVLGKHSVSREEAREFAAKFNAHWREVGATGQYLAGPVDAPPPREAFE